MSNCQEHSKIMGNQLEGIISRFDHLIELMSQLVEAKNPNLKRLSELLIGVDEAAELFHCKPDKIREYLKNKPNELPPYKKVGRQTFFRLDQALNWVSPFSAQSSPPPRKSMAEELESLSGGRK